MSGPEGYNPHETQAEDRLPRERLRDVARRSVVIEWSVALAVVVVINFAAFAAIDRFDPNRFRVQVDVKYDRVRDTGGKFDSLILGDSTPNQGIMPSALNEKVGGAWLNLATVADMQAISDAWLLQEYIDRYGPPKRVLICHVPDMWGREIDPVVLAQAPVPIAGFESLNPPVELTGYEKFLQMRARYLPIYSKNESLLQMVKMPWKISDERQAFGPDGFMSVEGKAENWRARVEAAIQEHAETDFSLSEHNAQAMRRIIALAEEHGFTVYLLPGSSSQPLAESAGYRRDFDAMIKQYRIWAASSDRVTLLMETPQTFTDPLMYDEDHVNAAGAVAWSERISQALLRVKQGTPIEQGAEDGGEPEASQP